MFQIYHDDDDNSFMCITKGENQWMITPTSELLLEVKCSTDEINVIYEEIIRNYDETN